MSDHLEFSDGKLQVSCPSCGRANAILLNKILDGPACGACQAKLPAVDRPVEVTDATFAALVNESPLPVLVDFWAPWCGPCRMLGPALESLARTKAGQAIIAKLNTQDNPLTPGKFGIRAIPTMIVFRSGQEVNRQVGALPPAELEGLLA